MTYLATSKTLSREHCPDSILCYFNTTLFLKDTLASTTSLTQASLPEAAMAIEMWFLDIIRVFRGEVVYKDENTLFGYILQTLQDIQVDLHYWLIPLYIATMYLGVGR